jgi:hypothetical protein
VPEQPHAEQSPSGGSNAARPVHVQPDLVPGTLRPLLQLLDSTTTPAVEELAQRLGQVIDAAATVLTVDGVGLMLLDGAGRPRPAGGSNELAGALEAAQVAAGQGPGMDCMRRDRTVAVAYLADATEYADLWARLREARAEVRAVLSAPVHAGGEVVGNLNALLCTPHTWTAAQVRATETYARVGGLARGVPARSARAGDALTRLRTHLAASTASTASTDSAGPLDDPSPPRGWGGPNEQDEQGERPW